ncbi:putative peroxisome biogenesis factor 1, N-terminal [Lyophyllum shimeji]|uniref:Peroxisomal ATPase PEX1 n=1 Tax=Lyophyllum shimeji TaxID=47721 RepID=A0A9P3PK20_LYOSH|nr:putative peroxisome biogenesis factor 1, N-terminal [Lyophyllum shimeji]
MPRRARIHFVSLRSSLVNLPISIYGPLLERSIRPQNLAVHLKLIHSPQDARAGVEAYVGWTGMASASSLAHFNATDSAEKGLETIEIDPQYAQGLGFTQGDLVEIGLLHDLPLAKSVATEPLTSDDWEIVEIHASHVESTLLSQVRVAKTGQEIDVWVMGRTRVRLKVVSLDPSSRGNALLLTTNTEVSIAPKPHRTEHRTGLTPVDNKPAAQAVASTTVEEKTIPHKRISEVLRVLPHKVSGMTLPEYAGPEFVGYVSPSTFTQLHSRNPTEDGDRISCFMSTVKRLLPPPNPSSPASMAPPPPPVPRIIKPGATDKDPASNDIGQVTDQVVFLGPLCGIPESHVVFPAAPRNVEDWDLLLVSPASEDQSILVDTLGEDIPTSTAFSATAPRSVLAGVDDVLERCTEFCIRKFILHSYKEAVRGVSALLLTGRQGTGKTSIVQHVAKTVQEDPRTFTYTHFVDVSRYAEQSIPSIKALLRYWFAKATWHRPSILILDNLDKLLSAEVEHADSFRTRQITELFLSLYSSSARTGMSNSRGTLLLATATSTAALHSLVNSSHIFQELINVKPPNSDARRDILQSIVRDRLSTAQDIHVDPESPLNYAALAMQTEGYSATDLQDLVGRAIHQVAMRVARNITPAVLTYADFTTAQVDFTPLSLRDVKLQKSDIAWSDIGGLHETRRVLRETLEWPTKYGPIFAQAPLRLRSGILLYGFPGCGKTLLASAVAKECGLNFISVKGPEILNKYIGASEKSVRDLFERASTAKPCVLFFDEFDSIAPKRGHDSTGVTDRVVNQMLTQMDGAEGLEGVYVLAATSRPDLIDSALLRPGRLDKSLLCGMPDLQERKEILEAVAKGVSLSPSVDLGEIAALTDGFSGADLQALLYNAHLEVIHASIASASDQSHSTHLTAEEDPIEFTAIGGPSTSKIASRAEKAALEKRLRQIQRASQAEHGAAKKMPSGGTKKHEITPEHIHRVLKTTRPSVSPEERLRLDRIYHAFKSGRSGDLPVPPEGGGIGHRVSLM